MGIVEDLPDRQIADAMVSLRTPDPAALTLDERAARGASLPA